MNTNRSRYHYRIRKLKKIRKVNIKAAFGRAIANNNSRDYWKETRKIKSSSKTLSCIIDGNSDTNLIANQFSAKYNHLYNSVNSDVMKMNVIKQTL